ncbi:hypothetical protein J6590_013521 [Homalodisca vitripennis]|nr:hypothetical protein J6590_013521 [Homalodisca vitripennis]
MLSLETNADSSEQMLCCDLYNQQETCNSYLLMSSGITGFDLTTMQRRNLDTHWNMLPRYSKVPPLSYPSLRICPVTQVLLVFAKDDSTCNTLANAAESRYSLEYASSILQGSTTFLSFTPYLCCWCSPRMTLPATLWLMRRNLDTHWNMLPRYSKVPPLSYPSLRICPVTQVLLVFAKDDSTCNTLANAAEHLGLQRDIASTLDQALEFYQGQSSWPQIIFIDMRFSWFKGDQICR